MINAQEPSCKVYKITLLTNLFRREIPMWFLRAEIDIIFGKKKNRSTYLRILPCAETDWLTVLKGLFCVSFLSLLRATNDLPVKTDVVIATLFARGRKITGGHRFKLLIEMATISSKSVVDVTFIIKRNTRSYLYFFTISRHPAWWSSCRHGRKVCRRKLRRKKHQTGKDKILGKNFGLPLKSELLL